MILSAYYEITRNSSTPLLHNKQATNEGISEGIKRRNLIVAAMRDNPNITAKKLAEKVGVSLATLECDLNMLKRPGSLSAWVIAGMATGS